MTTSRLLRHSTAALLIAACVSSAQAQQVREFTIYDDDAMDVWVPEFEKYYEAKTGEDIEIRLFKQPGEEMILTLQLEARAGKFQADAVLLHHYAITELQDKYNVFEAPLQITGSDDPAIIEHLRNPAGDGSAVPAIVFPWVIVYNTELVAPEDVPTKWSDVLDPKWTDKFGVQDPEVTAGGVASLWYISEHLADQGSPYGWEFYDQLAEIRPFLSPSGGTLLEMIASGELSLGFQSLFSAELRASDGDPIGVAQPEEGMPVSIQAFAVIASSPEADIGRALAEWIISKEGAQTILTNKSGLLPTRTDITNSPIPFEFDYAPDQFVLVDPTWFVEQRDVYLEKFRAAVR